MRVERRRGGSCRLTRVPAERRCGSCPVVWPERLHPTVPEAPPRVDPHRAPPQAERYACNPRTQVPPGRARSDVNASNVLLAGRPKAMPTKAAPTRFHDPDKPLSEILAQVRTHKTEYECRRSVATTAVCPARPRARSRGRKTPDNSVKLRRHPDRVPVLISALASGRSF
jgi:hypothetical protein